MRWLLGQPSALPPLFPRGAFEALGGSRGFRTGVVRAGGAALGFLSGQVQPSRAVQQPQPSCKRRQTEDAPRWFLLGLGLESGQLRPMSRLLHPAAAAAEAAAARSGRRTSGLLCCLSSPLEAKAADPHRLCLQTRRDFAVSGEGSRQASSDLGPRKTTGASSENDLTDSSQENKKPNKSQQLKTLFKEYGSVGVSFHVGISLMSLGMFYLVVSSGVDVAAIFSRLGFNEALVQSKLAAGTSTFVLAYAIHKLFAPVRISITIVSVPFLVRYFRKRGFFKPPSPKP